MAAITFISDFGLTDHYVASVKAKVLCMNGSIPVIDVSHQISPFGIAEAAFVLGAVFRDFPAGTVHLIGLTAQGTQAFTQAKPKYLALKLEDHYFVGMDNGIFSLLSSKRPAAIVELMPKKSTFITRDILAPAAVFLASEKPIYELGLRIDDVARYHNRELKITSDQVTGHVVHVDHYGNLITSIDIETFQTTVGEKPFAIRFMREKVTSLHDGYHQVDSGDVVVLFNSLGLLEIAINEGNAAQLLGMRYESPITIEILP